MQKKLLVNIQFKNKVYIKNYDNINNKNFVWCCDLLILKNYEEFEKVLKKEYWNMDNSIMVIDTINSDNVDHFKYILQYIEIYDMEKVLLYCLFKGLFNISNYILSNNPKFNDYENYIEISIRTGSLKFYKMHRKKCKDLNYSILVCTIAKAGNLKYLKRFIKKCKYLTPYTLGGAVRYGNINILNYLVNNHKDLLENQIGVLFCAVIYGDKKNIEYILSMGYKFNENIGANYIDIAIYKNNFKILDWLLNKGCGFGLKTFSKAAGCGNLKIMKWLLKHKCKLYDDTLNSAITYGNLNNIKWLISNGCYIQKNALIFNTSINKKEIEDYLNNIDIIEIGKIKD